METTITDPLAATMTAVPGLQLQRSQMRRLAFSMPEFVRVSWCSEQARTIWEPRLRRIGEAWSQIEWRSVAASVRSCALVFVSPRHYVVKANAWIKLGLVTLPLGVQSPKNHYSISKEPASPGRPFLYRTVLGNARSVLDFKDAFDASDDKAIGKLLGFPECCVDFYRKIWVSERLLDTTWPMALGTSQACITDETVVLSGPIEANILWRWMNVRSVPHLPCSFDCDATVEFGRTLLQLGKDIGCRDEIGWIEEILSWPVEWSALHGIAEIKTPVLRVSASTDATPCKYRVQRQGKGYPLEGATGNCFPYRRFLNKSPESNRPTPAATRERLYGIDAISVPNQSWFPLDNGFQTIGAMEAAHRLIVLQVVDAVAVLPTSETPNIIDLGCGNGALLKKTHDHLPNCGLFGIELSQERVRHSKLVLTGLAATVRVGNFFTEEQIWRRNGPYSVVLLMLGRLREVDVDTAQQFLSTVAKKTKGIVCYLYKDRQQALSQNLFELGRDFGLTLTSFSENHIVQTGRALLKSG